jgi:tryptophan synthase alpha chain
MNRLRSALALQVAGGRKTLLPYLTAGYPDLATTLAILRRLDPATCLCAELGIPYSDPIADGPVIQHSFARALEAGFRVDDLLAALAAHRDEIAVPLLAMVSFAIVYRRGPEAFVAAATAAGLDGLIVPDLAIEEADELAAIARRHDAALVLIAAPTSPPERRRRIAALSDPFLYYQSVMGVTGERAGLPAGLADEVAQLRGEAGKPVCVGFGISRPEQVAAVCTSADGAIVGSAIVRRITAAAQRGDGPDRIAAQVAAFVRELGAPLRPGGA